MDKETLEALERSIKKWEAIVAGKGEDRGGENCALCELFAEYECVGCPVHTEIGETNCQGTPFHEWVNHHEERHPESFSEALKVECSECKELAQKELEFLKSLLPETQKIKKKEKKENEKGI